MKIFAEREVEAAREFAREGGQALHLMAGTIADAMPHAPACFRGQIEIAHLFDQDRERLVMTARRLGVRIVYVHRDGTPSQHIDLCRGPLAAAKAIAWR